MSVLYCAVLSCALLHHPLQCAPQGLFKSLAGHLRPFAKPRGAAAQRWAHTMLEALVLKVSKRGATVVNRRPRRVTVEVRLLRCTALQCMALRWSVRHCHVVSRTTLLCTALQCGVRQCTVVYANALRCMLLQCNVRGTAL